MKARAHIRRRIHMSLIILLVSIGMFVYDGENKAVNAEATPQLDITQGRLVYHRYSKYGAFDSELMLFNFATKKVEVLSKDWPVRSPMNAHFSPNGKYITFMALPPTGKGYYDMDVYIYNFKTKELRNLTKNSGIADEDPKFSAGGSRIVFKQKGDIKIMDRDGQILQTITNDGYLKEESMPYFSHDNKSLVYTEGSGPEAKIQQYDFATQETKTIIDLPGVMDYYPITTPTAIWFTSQEPSSGMGDQLFTYDIATGRITPANFNDPYRDDSDVAPISSALTAFSGNRYTRGDYDIVFANTVTGTVYPMNEWLLNSPKNELGASYTPYMY